jgi:GNAT superfamily N-acetyltransferase
MDTATITPLTASPVDVATLIADVIAATVDPLISDGMIARAVEPARMARIIAERTWFEARGENGTLLGVACVHQSAPDTALIGSVYVAQRGVGIGGQLLDACLEWAQAHGLTRASAHVSSWNTPSLAMMASRGLQVEADEPDTWNGGTLHTVAGPVALKRLSVARPTAGEQAEKASSLGR